MLVLLGRSSRHYDRLPRITTISSCDLFRQPGNFYKKDYCRQIIEWDARRRMMGLACMRAHWGGPFDTCGATNLLRDRSPGNRTVTRPINVSLHSTNGVTVYQEKPRSAETHERVTKSFASRVGCVPTPEKELSDEDSATNGNIRSQAGLSALAHTRIAFLLVYSGNRDHFQLLSCDFKNLSLPRYMGQIDLKRLANGA